jgi:hypothetical protein|tara:strand:- start:227 stop:1108 length:882 start_codon:yes stop_codon:yes gene_type:complete
MLLFVALLMLVPSCTDKEEPIPAYLYIPLIELEVSTDGTQGSNAHDILDAWVYVNGQLIGAFEMPATIPILASGNSRINVFAGVKDNGLTNKRIRYPFYRSFDTDMDLTPGKVDTLIPKIVYNQNAKFSWLEDFEDGSVSLEKSGSFTTVDSLYITENPADVYAYNGTTNLRSGAVDIPGGAHVFENSTIQSYALPRSGQDIYLELNFKCNTETVIGLYPITSNVVQGFPLVNLFSTVDEFGEMQWKKVYISLVADVNNPEYAGAEFRPFISAQTNRAEESKLFFDNIKLVHF